ncbi:MAG TPA: sigma-70 family RNA polymerase sigma factor [Candidatus Dormibacteraeota bacterium]
MNQREWMAEEFETHRTRLRAVAYRMLGSTSESEDAVQEAWLRLNRLGPGHVENLGGWLTTVVGRVCLDMLRSRKSRREEPLDTQVEHAAASPEQEVVLADSVGLALLVVLETLTPAERVAFVLHDMFAMPFEDIAPIVGRSEAATRQLASRARRRVQGGEVPSPPGLARRQEIVDAFLAASRGGEFDALLTLLDPDVVLRADASAVEMGAAKEARGARAVAETFAGRARVAQPVLIDGAPGLVWESGGKPRVVFAFTIEDGRITGIELIADTERINELDLA